MENSRYFSVKSSQLSSGPPVLSEQKEQQQPIEQTQKTTNNLLPDNIEIITFIRSIQTTESDSHQQIPKSYTEKVTTCISNSDITDSNSDQSIFSSYSIQNSLKDSLQNSLFTDSMFSSNTSSILKLKPIETTDIPGFINFLPVNNLISGENSVATSKRIPTEYITTPVFGDLLSKISELERNLQSCQRLICL